MARNFAYGVSGIAVGALEIHPVHGTKGMDELYDLSEDPYEMRNAIGGGEGTRALPALQGELERLGRS